jgi:hypothetical protein
VEVKRLVAKVIGKEENHVESEADKKNYSTEAPHM